MQHRDLTPEQMASELTRLREERGLERDRHAFLEKLVDSLRAISGALLVEDRERRVVLANEAFCAMFGLPGGPSSLEGTDCGAMARASAKAFLDPEAFVARIEEILERGEPVEDEELRMVDGRTLLRDFVPIGSNGARGHVWQYRDVTAQRAGEALNRAIIVTSLDAIVTMDHRGRIVEFNPAAEAMFGHRRQDVLGKAMGDVIVPEHLREAHAAGLDRYLSSGEPHILGKRLELPALRSDGSEFPIELAVNLIPDSDPPMFTGFMRDISEAKRRSEELESAREVAEQASRAKSDFLAMMSHEIRTPMNAILGMTELSLDMADHGEQESLLRSVQTNAESLLHVINDVLDLSKVEAGRLVLREEAFSVADVMESVTEALSARAFEKGLELACAVDPALTAPVEGDPNRLRQILVNLLGNAVKFTDQGHVSLSADALSDGDDEFVVRFSVEDTGIGISPQALERIFEPFYQSDATLSRTFGGTGLGLGISNSLVDLMGGRIWAESVEGEGSVFHFEVSLRKSRRAFARRRASDASYERWQAWVITPTESLALGVTRGLASVHIPCRWVEGGDLAEHLADEGSSSLRHLVVADQRLGLTALSRVADAAREAGPDLDVRLCVLVPPGPVEPWRVDGPAETVYAVKPPTRRKLCSVVARSADQEEDVVQVTHPMPERLSGRILLVEDNPANQHYASRVLARAGYDVAIAEDGLIGLRMAAEADYDLIVTDLDMPNMDGIEMAKEVRERLGDEAPPILAFTAHVVEGFRERCLSVGMVGFVAKPAKPEELLAGVRSAVREGPVVLVVDDSTDNLELTRRFLATEHLTIEALDSGRDAIERVRGGGVAAMLLDMNMPGLDGYETARRVRALPEGAQLPILAMTSWVGAEEEARCLDAGCTAYIEKPLRRGALIDAVARLLEPAVATTPRPQSDTGVVRVDPAIADLVPQYLADRVQDVASLRDSLRKGDLESIRVLAHNLAGSGEPYGFSRLTELGRALENVAISGGREEVGTWIEEIEAYLTSVEWEVGED